MILFSLFYFVPENENDMLSGFGLFLGWDCAFSEGKRDFCTNRGWDCAFSKRKEDFCKIDICIGTEAKEISCFVKFYLTELL